MFLPPTVQVAGEGGVGKARHPRSTSQTEQDRHTAQHTNRHAPPSDNDAGAIREGTQRGGTVRKQKPLGPRLSKETSTSFECVGTSLTRPASRAQREGRSNGGCAAHSNRRAESTRADNQSRPRVHAGNPSLRKPCHIENRSCHKELEACEPRLMGVLGVGKRVAPQNPAAVGRLSL